MSTLTCQRARELVLAPVADATLVNAARQHVLTCPRCASNTSDDIDEVAISQINSRRLTHSALRQALLVIATIQSLIALPWIFGVAFLWIGSGDDAIGHVTRDGVIGFVIGIVGMAVALRPALAYFAISVCSIQVFLQAITIGFDIIDNDVAPKFELLHLLALIILLLVVRIAFPRKK